MLRGGLFSFEKALQEIGGGLAANHRGLELIFKQQ